MPPTDATSNRPAWWQRRLPGALLVAVVGALVFGPALAGPFLLDDVPLIANNVLVHSFEHVRSWLFSDFWDLDLAAAQHADRLSYYRPLISASYAADWLLSGSPAAFHVTNLLLHATASALTFLALRRWTRAAVPSLVGALVLAVHPAKAESVAWISGRPDIAVVIGILVATSGVALRLDGRRIGLPIEALGAAIAYGSKETAVVLPAFAVVEGWCWLGRPALTVRAVRPLLAAAAPQVVLMVGYVLARHLFLPLRGFEITGLSAWHHLALVFETVARLTELVFVPWDLSLLRATVRTGPHGAQPNWVCAGAGVVVVALALLVALRMARSRPAVSVAALLWLGLLLPVSNLVYSGMLSFTSPRFLYLPLVAVVWAGIELAKLQGRIPPRTGLLLGLLVIVGLASRSVVRSGDFRTETAFWRYEIENNRHNAVGYVFAASHARAQRRWRRALALAELGFRLSSRDFTHLRQRSTLLVDALELLAKLAPDRDAATLQHVDGFIQALVRQRDAKLHFGMGVIEVPVGSKVRQHLRSQLPRLDLLRAELALRRGSDRRALEFAKRAIAACPRCTAEWQRAARVALGAGDLALARLWFAGPRREPWSHQPRSVRRVVSQVEVLARAAREAPTDRLRRPIEAQRLVLVGLFGRGLEQLGPLDANASAAGARSLAALAYRAGATDAARRLLGDVPPGEQRALFDTWALSMGWQDAPMDESADREYESMLSALIAREDLR